MARNPSSRTVKVYSTLSKAKTELVTKNPDEVSMYVCGPTVYDEPHLGHARSALSFDVIRRYLEYKGWRVTYVMNYTDVDDKIIDRAAREQVSASAIAERYIDVWDTLMGRLGVKRPTVAPRATDHIDGMVELIKTLVDSGHAYVAGGDVYFAIESYPAYGELSGKNVAELQAGARVEPGEHKKHPLDFALWKASDVEPRWNSPWSKGRPGWHIECSVMSLQYLGEGFDIHGGGQDLIFPHHENERAQAEAAGRPFARYWLHTGLVNLSGEKMAKSTGNFVTLAQALAQYGPAAIRMLALRSHYRSPVDFGPEEMSQAAAGIERIVEFGRRASAYLGRPMLDRLASDTATGWRNRSTGPDGLGATVSSSTDGRGTYRRCIDAFRAAMDDDFNTPGALAALFDAVKAGNQAIDARAPAEAVEEAARAVEEVAGALGFELEPPRPAEEEGVVAELVEAVLELREALRAAKMYDQADRARKRLERLGVVVEDTPEGPRWHWRR